MTIFQLLVRFFPPLLLPVSLAYTNSNIAILLLETSTDYRLTIHISSSPPCQWSAWRSLLY